MVVVVLLVDFTLHVVVVVVIAVIKGVCAGGVYLKSQVCIGGSIDRVEAATATPGSSGLDGGNDNQ